MIDKGDFRFRDDLYNVKKGETVPIEILIPPYKDVIIRYTRVAVKEKDDGTAVLQFDYEILEPGQYSMVTLRKDPKFETHLGLLLNYLILEAAEAGDEPDENREDYLEEPDTERGVHS